MPSSTHRAPEACSLVCVLQPCPLLCWGSRSREGFPEQSCRPGREGGLPSSPLELSPSPGWGWGAPLHPPTAALFPRSEVLRVQERLGHLRPLLGRGPGDPGTDPALLFPLHWDREGEGRTR